MSEFQFVCPFCSSKLLCDETTENQICNCPECGSEIVPARERFAGKLKKAPQENASMANLVENSQPRQQIPIAIPANGGGQIVINNYNTQQPTQAYPQQYFAGNNNLPKQRIVYILLGLFLGACGVHNFYAGYKREATWQLVVWAIGMLTLFCGGFILCFASGVWALANIVCRNVDANGRPMI